jgi:hypothetical protein
VPLSPNATHGKSRQWTTASGRLTSSTRRLKQSDPGNLPKGDPRKARITQQVRSTTTAPLRWLADRLHMGTSANILHACHGSLRRVMSLWGLGRPAALRLPDRRRDLRQNGAIIKNFSPDPFLSAEKTWEETAASGAVGRFRRKRRRKSTKRIGVQPLFASVAAIQRLVAVIR